MLETNIFLNILLFDFFLIDGIERNRNPTHANRSAVLKHILTKMHVQHEHLYFYLHYALDIILGDRCDRKILYFM